MSMYSVHSYRNTGKTCKFSFNFEEFLEEFNLRFAQNGYWVRKRLKTRPFLTTKRILGSFYLNLPALNEQNGENLNLSLNQYSAVLNNVFKAQKYQFSFILYHLRSQLSPKLQRLKTGKFFSNAFFLLLRLILTSDFTLS